MKRFNETTFIDKEGKKVRKVLDNGFIETSLIEPSQWYIEKILKPMQRRYKEAQDREKREEKIVQKMREMAERELEKEKRPNG